MSDQGTLLLARTVLPVRPARSLLEDHAVRVVRGRIAELLPREAALERFPQDDRIELPRHVLMPGLINMHTHSPMSLLRGYADDLALDAWLKEHIWPAEQRWVSPAFVRDGTALAMVEMLRGGQTCFNEMYFFPEVIADLVDGTGLRALIGTPVIDVQTPWASGIEDCLRHADAMAAAWGEHERVSIALAPHAPYTVDDDGLAATRSLADRWGLRVNMHVLEAAWEIDHSRKEYGRRVLQRLQDQGLLNDEFMAVHMVHLDDQDVAQLVETGAHVIHCPESNLKLASGVSPVSALLDAGVNVAIGTDGAASNNDLDLLGEVRTAALVAKGFSGNPEALDAWTAIEMMTLNGARALGQEHQLGSIEPGKWADLCALDLEHPETLPLHHVHSQLVYSASARQFTDVWVAGRRLLTGGEVTATGLETAVEQAREWQTRMHQAPVGRSRQRQAS
jgi:5-methylthioadenosine/S-adenosylhomocysteine deaminase